MSAAQLNDLKNIDIIDNQQKALLSIKKLSSWLQRLFEIISLKKGNIYRNLKYLIIFQEKAKTQRNLFDLIQVFFIHIIMITSLLISYSYCTNGPSTSVISIILQENNSVIMMREHASFIDKFNEKEIARNAEGFETGIAVDRVPIVNDTNNDVNALKNESRIRRRRHNRQRGLRHDEDLINVFLPTFMPFTTILESNIETASSSTTTSNQLTSSSILTPQNSPHQHHSSSFVPCENNGTYINGKCRCYFPFAGERCADFACEHGLSVGPRYDAESTFFNRKCICDEDWAGEYCNIPIADQCNERGQYIRGRCKCHGYYFGPKCQYVGKCVYGKLQEGICKCSYGYEGDYCDRIVCHHGYPDKSNDSNSCVCPPRHAGMFCDECALTGDYILPYPNCTEERIPYRARQSREKTDDLIYARLLILGVAFLLLGACFAAMFVIHWGRRRAELYEANGEMAVREKQRAALIAERTQLLKRVIQVQAPGALGLLSATADDTGICDSEDGPVNCLGGSSTRRNSRFADSTRFDHDLI